MLCERRVLAVIHNVTAATRLLDVIDLVAEDTRVQVEYTVTGSSAFTVGTERFLADRGIAPLPFSAAVGESFHLAITASHGGELQKIGAPLIILPHGIGYNKYLGKAGKPESRKAGKPESRKAGKPESRKAGKPESRKAGKPVFGLSADWLLSDGEVVPSALVLSHVEQRDRLALACPEALNSVVLAGDPCLDRMTASLPLRSVYRRALGVGEQRLVFVSSTWGPDSLFQRHTDLVRRLAAELPMDEYRVVAALHPNTVYRHGEHQVRAWLAACRRAGVIVLPPDEGWRAGLVAADVVIGDHGSVTFYGAALGRPTLLATAPEHTVAPDSAIGRFLRAAARLDPAGPLAGQIDAAISGYDPAREPLASVVGLATSVPGAAMALLRKEFYRLIDLPEPAAAAATRLVPVPAQAESTACTQLVTVELDGNRAHVTRLPAEAVDDLPRTGAHLSVGVDEPQRRLLDHAEIVVVPNADDAQTVLFGLPGCLLATGPTDVGTWLVVTSSGERVEFRSAAGRVCASVVHAWLSAGGELDAFPKQVSVHLGRAVHDMTMA